jgi:hypothetical protein
VVVEPDDLPPFVLGEPVLVQKVEGVGPLTMDAEVEDAHAEFVGNVGEVMFWVDVHTEFNTEGTESSQTTEKK